VVWQADEAGTSSLLFARAIVASTGRVSLDGGFGTGGVDRFSPDTPGCWRNVYLGRMTLWNGHPTVAGRINHSCAGDIDHNTDYHVVRLNRNFLFADGVE
jgi:hypothetical protein